MPEVRIVGSAYPTLELTLAAGEDVVVDPGRIGWYAPSVRLHTGTGPRRHGGLLAATARRLGGGSFLVTTVRGPGLVALAAAVPGHIVPVTLADGEGLLVHQHALLAYEASVHAGVGFQHRFRAGVWGGDGFVLQRLTGPGTAWLAFGGDPVEYRLDRHESLNVHPGFVAAFDARMTFSLAPVASVSTILFGETGLYMAHLQGPGRVIVQSWSVAQLAGVLAPFLEPGAPD